MKKRYVLLIALLCLLLFAMLIAYFPMLDINGSGDRGISTYYGEIIYISELDNGYLLYVKQSNNYYYPPDILLEVWVTDNTMIFGEIDGFSLESIIKEKTPGADISFKTTGADFEILDHHMVFPAFTITAQPDEHKSDT